MIPLYTPECRQCKSCLSQKTNLCTAIRATQGKGLMPDGTTRFSHQGKPIFHYMGCSTFSNFTVLPEIAVAKIREDAPFDKSCYIGCGVTTGVGAVVNTAKVTPGANVVVFGLGGIGLNVIQGARMVGADKIIGVDLNDSKEEWGRRFGMTHFVNPKKIDGDIVAHLVALTDGYRQSTESWADLLRDCRRRGMRDPELVVGDGAMGLWKALAEVFPASRHQRCWVHKTANVLDKLRKGSQPKAKRMLHEIYQAEGKAGAGKAFDLFIKTYEAKYPKATECLSKDREVLLSFYEFPAEHWVHIRTTNPIESVFATVRLRHDKTKGSGTRAACLTMVFKLMESASRGWRSLNGSPLLAEVIRGTKFIDGIREKPAA